MTKMTVRHIQGEPRERTLAWAENCLVFVSASLEHSAIRGLAGA